MHTALQINICEIVMLLKIDSVTHKERIALDILYRDLQSWKRNENREKNILQNTVN